MASNAILQQQMPMEHHESQITNVMISMELSSLIHQKIAHLRMKHVTG